MSRKERLLLLAVPLILLAAALVFHLADPGDFATFFSWPSGGVWSNIVASAVLGAPALYAILRRMARHHEEHMRTLHEHHQAQLEAIRRG